MSENITYATLNFTDSAKPKLQNITDVEGHTYAEVKAQSLDTNPAATCTLPDPNCHTDTVNFKESRRGKSCCSRACVAGLVAVLILLALAVGLIIMYYPTASSSPDSKTDQPDARISPNSKTEHPAASSTPDSKTGTSAPAAATVMSREPRTPGENNGQDHTGCPQHWQKHGNHCYCFFPKGKEMDWNTSRQQCDDMGSDLVVIESQEELEYLHNQSRGHYYLLGLTYSESNKTWKWLNNMDHNTSMFPVERSIHRYNCSVIGHGEIADAPCNGSSTTQNMCKKPATPSERSSREKKKTSKQEYYPCLPVHQLRLVPEQDAEQQRAATPEKQSQKELQLDRKYQI